MKIETLKRTKAFLGMKEMCDIFECTEAAIYARIARGDLPRKDKIGGVKGWDSVKLRKFLGVTPYKIEGAS